MMQFTPSLLAQQIGRQTHPFLTLWEEKQREGRTTAKSIFASSPLRAERSVSCREVKSNTSTFQARLYPLCRCQSHTIPFWCISDSPSFHFVDGSCSRPLTVTHDSIIDTFISTAIIRTFITPPCIIPLGLKLSTHIHRNGTTPFSTKPPSVSYITGCGGVINLVHI